LKAIFITIVSPLEMPPCKDTSITRKKETDQLQHQQ
jgi:hypothetical protein